MAVTVLAYYVDVNQQFTQDQRDILLVNIETINGQINNILDTSVGERFGDVNDEPSFGSEIPLLLFDPIDEVTAWKIETGFFKAIQRWMGSRISLDTHTTRVIPDMKGQAYYSSIYYTILSSSINAEYHVMLTRT